MYILACDKDTVCRHWEKALPGDARYACISSWAELLDALAGRQDALILLHLGLPNLGGKEGVRRLRRLHPRARIMVFSDHPDDMEGLNLLQAGVQAYLNSYTHPGVLATALEVVQMGEVWVGRELMNRLIRGLGNAPPEAAPGPGHILELLTTREREIALLVADGASNKVVAARVGITERTVKAHLTSIFSKTGVRDRLQLALKVRESSPPLPLHQAGLN